MSLFEEDTRVEQTGDGRYSGTVDAAWNIGENPNGGYLVSIALAALADVAGDVHPDPVSVTTHFLRPGSPGVICDIAVQVVRQGRSLSTLRATLSQEGKSRIEVIAAFADLGTSAGVSSDITIAPPELPQPDDCPKRDGKLQGVDLPLLSRLDIRLHPDLAEPGRATSPEVSGWIRFADGRPSDSRSLVLFADTFPPSPFGVLGVVGWVPTLELTVHVRRRPADGWIKARFVTDDLSEGA
ncbi:MAG: thioesterase family protein [Gammaproteobacteria bacterium]|nr:thioesterase family protein [Gammaproteobacteria bacterium]